MGAGGGREARGAPERRVGFRDMRLIVAAVGKLGGGAERELVERYDARLALLARNVRIGPASLAEVEARGADARQGAAARKRAEGTLLLKALEPAERLVALDERGVDLGSLDIAERLRSWRDDGVGAVGFAIGGADGLEPALREKAALIIRFGKATWPHAMARAMLYEQLYRAAASIAGHPYHREG